MRKIKKKFCAIGLSLALAVSAIWQGMPALATISNQTSEKQESDLEISSKAINSYRDIDEAPPISVKEYEKNHIPQDIQDINSAFASAYTPDEWDDSNTTSLPAVRNQNPLGTCWAHSAMAMIEMYLVKKYGVPAYDADMSEFQSVFFMNHDWTDPLGLCSGDNFHTIDENGGTALASNWYDHGGNTAFTKFMLMDWVGAVSETKYDETKYSVLKEKEGNAYLDDSYAISKDMAHVQNVNVINSKDTDVIKQMIMDCGAVGISYWHDDSYYNETNQSYYNSNNTSTNHAVVIVGWDDNFDKSQFNTAPSNNGAWLIRNSWGSDWGKNGYFWISYDDTSLSDTAYSLEATYKSDYEQQEDYYDHNYQYDGGISTSKMSYNNAELSVEEANVFTAAGEEELKAVAIYTGANYKYDIKVYTGLTDKSNPVSGTEVTSISGTQAYEGYHTVKLNDSVVLNQGDIFSVVVTLKNNNSGVTEIALDNTMKQSWIYSESESEEGQSFYRPAGDNYGWTDAGANGANLRIKAYTNDYVENPITSIEIRNTQLEINAGETYNFADNITITPETHNDRIKYSSSDESIATIDENGVITALCPGNVNITVEAVVGKVKAEANVSVVLAEVNNPITKITIPETEYEMQVGDTYNLADNMTVEPAEHDDLLIYSSDDKSIATVDNKGLITALRTGDVVITVKSYTNNITVNITIHVISSGKPAEAITLSVEKLNLIKGKTKKIDAILTPADSDDEITWTSSASDVATVDTSGNVTGVAKGTATITATTTSGKSASCEVNVKEQRGEIISCVYNKIPKKIYKFNTYKISLHNAMQKLSPVSIEWAIILGNKDNIKLTPVGENGKDGCELYVNQVASARNRGEKLRLSATVTYIKKTRKGDVTKTKTFKRAATSYNLSYELKLDTERLDKEGITFVKKGDTVPLSVIFNEGEVDDQPTSTKVKWMVTDATGKKDRTGSKFISVNSKGIIKSKAPGVTYVTAFAKDSYVKASKSYMVSDTIKVTCVPVTSVSFSEASLTLSNLGTSDLRGKLIFNGGVTEPFNKDGMRLKWISSDKKCVSVNSKGIVKVTKKAVVGETYKVTVQATGGVPKGQTVPETTINIIVQ